MKLEHIGIAIRDSSDIKRFYQNILGMNEVRDFCLNKELAWEIFGINYNPKVHVLEKDNMFLEIFISPELYNQCFRHLCISVKDRNLIIKKANQRNYEIIHKKRGKSDLVFIRDKAGNIFEYAKKAGLIPS